MEGNQKIQCTVDSCKYNDQEENMCTLKKIEVKPMQDCCTEDPEETLCASYNYDEEE